MLQKECMIVRDLLPSYIEQLTNDTTTRVVETHLQECKKCREIYQERLFQYEEESRSQGKTEKKFLGKLKRYRYPLLGGLIGVMLPILLIIVWFGAIILIIKSMDTPAVHTQKAEEYGQFENYYGLSPLALFPTEEEIESNGGVIQKYAYDCYGDKVYQNCQIYLECEYSKEEYEKEAERLKKVTCQETGKQVVYSEDDYFYPAVNAIVDSVGCHEYALFVEDENKIIYIYLQGYIDRRQLYFEEKYLHVEYGQHGMEFEDTEEFSIYPEEE